MRKYFVDDMGGRVIETMDGDVEAMDDDFHKL
jgi:hypothetical protein